MSNIYVLEPPTNGKVIMHTNYGEIGVELWGREAPKAVRNFVQLCMEGYYDNTIANRVSKGYMVQMGDPTGTGYGGDSIYDGAFKDEFHQRLRFTRRGLVAMANTGPNDNRSQFFITLDKTDELNKKHTIFGRIDQDTIYNLLRLGEVDTDEDERPLNPPRIKYAEVLINPFNDIVPRATPGRLLQKEQKRQRATDKKKGSRMRKTKDTKLLSFADDEDEDGVEGLFETKNIKIKSSHLALADPTLAVEADETGHVSSAIDENRTEDRNEESGNASRVVACVKSPEPKNESVKKDDSVSTAEQEKELLREIKASRKRRLGLDEEVKQGKLKLKEEDKVNEGETYLEAQQSKYAHSIGASAKAKNTIKAKALLDSFREKVTAASWVDKEESDEGEANSETKFSGKSWLDHTLAFDDADRVVLSKDPYKDNAVDMYDLFDPRNPLTKDRRERDKKDIKSSGIREEDRKGRDERMRNGDSRRDRGRESNLNRNDHSRYGDRDSRRDRNSGVSRDSDRHRGDHRTSSSSDRNRTHRR
eukprot:CFRG8088T1